MAVLLSPVFLVDGVLLSTDSIQPLTWLACGWCLVRLIQTHDERWWLGFGLSAGISLAGKYLIFFYLAGLAAGVMATPLRRSTLTIWLYAGALIALTFVAPSLYWQAENGWPFIEVNMAGVGAKNLAFSPLGFLGQQIVFVGPAAAPIWLATERGAQSILPQYFADMFGWREMAEKVSAVYNSLPPDQRAQAVFFGRNYGEAAALDVYGPALHGPPAISGHKQLLPLGTAGV